MDSQEGISLGKMAVAILLVLLVIGAVVSIAYAAYSWFTSGADKLEDQVVSIDKSSFSQYDDAIVSGSNVLSALKTYRESNIAVLISNTNIRGGGAYAAGADVQCANYCALVDGAHVQNANDNKEKVDYQVQVTYVNDQYQLAGLDYADDGVSINKNTNFSPTTQTGRKNCFVKQTADWYANLVYDAETGDVAGILFQQVN